MTEAAGETSSSSSRPGAAAFAGSGKAPGLVPRCSWGQGCAKPGKIPRSLPSPVWHQNSINRDREGLRESQIYVIGQGMQVRPCGHGDKKETQGNRKAPAP